MERGAHALSLVELEQALVIILHLLQLVQVGKDVRCVALAATEVHTADHVYLALEGNLFDLLKFVCLISHHVYLAHLLDISVRRGHL